MAKHTLPAEEAQVMAAAGYDLNAVIASRVVKCVHVLMERPDGSIYTVELMEVMQQGGPKLEVVRDYGKNPSA